MASVQYLFSLSFSLEIELLEKQIEFTNSTKFRTICAILIQKTWRGYFNRVLYHKKRRAIITIQSYCRGWLVRKHHNDYVADHEHDMYILNLNNMATRIQAAWRGYAVRKMMRFKGLLPKDLLKKREEIHKINLEVQGRMRKQFDEEEAKKKLSEIESDKQLVLYILFKCHHLLRTRQVEGIYSHHGCKELSIIEQLMKALPLKEYMRELRKTYNSVYNKVKNASPVYLFDTKNGRKLEDLVRMRDKSQDIREPKPRDIGYMNYKRFICSSKIMKAFERDIMTLGKYENPVDVLRDFDKTKNVCSQEFLLHPNVELNDKTIPYYIDMWNKIICEIHNIPDDD